LNDQDIWRLFTYKQMFFDTRKFVLLTELWKEGDEMRPLELAKIKSSFNIVLSNVKPVDGLLNDTIQIVFPSINGMLTSDLHISGNKRLSVVKITK
jgi:hypothetical protein